MANEQTVSVQARCPFCGHINVVDDVPVDGLTEWYLGELIQNALPNLNADKREMLMTGICPSCWNHTV